MTAIGKRRHRSASNDRASVTLVSADTQIGRLAEVIFAETSDPLECACRLFERGVEALERGDVRAAESLLLDSLEIFEREIGEDSPDVAHILSVLAEVYSNERHFGDAEWCAERSLEIIGRADPQSKRTDPDVGMLCLQALEGLAGIYQIEGHTEKSEPLRRQARRLEHRMCHMRRSGGRHLTRLSIDHWPSHCRW